MFVNDQFCKVSTNVPASSFVLKNRYFQCLSHLITKKNLKLLNPTSNDIIETEANLF